jgi:hypothetical protein
MGGLSISLNDIKIPKIKKNLIKKANNNIDTI